MRKQSDADRVHQAMQADLDREHQMKTTGATIQSAEKLAKMKPKGPRK